jgi:hypothetical protein
VNHWRAMISRAGDSPRSFTEEAPTTRIERRTACSCLTSRRILRDTTTDITDRSLFDGAGNLHGWSTYRISGRDRLRGLACNARDLGPYSMTRLTRNNLRLPTDRGCSMCRSWSRSSVSWLSSFRARSFRSRFGMPGKGTRRWLAVPPVRSHRSRRCTIAAIARSDWLSPDERRSLLQCAGAPSELHQGESLRFSPAFSGSQASPSLRNRIPRESPTTPTCSGRFSDVQSWPHFSVR